MDIRVAGDLWASTMFPEGTLERWLVADGSAVKLGEAIAEVRIEDSLHEMIAPANGCLVVELRSMSIIEPGSILGRIDRARDMT